MLDRFSPDPKPKRSAGGIGRPKGNGPRRFRVVAGASEWDRLHEAKDGPCLVCVWTGAEQLLPSSLHHVVPRSQGGDDCEENLIPLCGDGTKGHHGLVEAHEAHTCRLTAAAVQQYDGAAYAYAIEKLGELRFLRRYCVVFTKPLAALGCCCDPVFVALGAFDALCPEHGFESFLGSPA